MRALWQVGVLGTAAVGGAVAFWLPGMVLRGVTGSPVPGFLLLTFLGPVIVRWAAMHLADRLLTRPGGRWIAEAMLAGIWFLGPIFMICAAALAGELSFARAGSELRELYAYSPLVPLVTLIFSGADGSLVGLLAASCVLAYTSAELRPDDGGEAARREPVALSWVRPGENSGGRCMVCATDLAPGQPVHRCPSCDTELHLDCHVYLGGCGRFGCPEALRTSHRACSRLL